MPRCKRCGKRGLFQKLTSDDLCKECERVTALEAEAAALDMQISAKTDDLTDLTGRYDDIYADMVEKTKREALAAVASQIQERETELANVETKLARTNETLDQTENERESTQKKLDSAAGSLVKVQSAVKAIRSSLKRYSEFEAETNLPTTEDIANVDELLSTTVEVHFHSMDVRELKRRFAQNKATIKDLLKRYQSRYTTKANIAIYRLMVIGLEAELQNVLSNLKYDKLKKALENISAISTKYETIAAEGNQSIAPTVRKFIGEIAYLYEEAVRIEYEYYTKKERIKEEQRALRQQMREEAAERKRLEEERKKIEAEESKYLSEIESLKAQLAEAKDDLRRQQIDDRMDELKGQLDELEEKKEGIIRLEHGKAGYVYVISNLGSFGDDVFKIGMTRRLDPQDRVDELGDASVPFRYDVHTTIFSNDAPNLENSIHRRLHTKRLNRINLRREFFRSTIDEIEELVYELEPSAEFSRTMLAEEYRQSLEMEDIPDMDTSVNIEVDDEEEDVFEDEAGA